MAEELGNTDRERRTASREAIHRVVVFAGVRGEGLLRQGMAVDISASGLLIHTTQPDLVGRHLEIELHPDGAPVPGEVVMVRGEVVWVSPVSGKKEYAMGLRFLQSMPATDATGAHYRPANREEATVLANSIQRRLQSMEPAARLEISDAARRNLPPAGMASVGGEVPPPRAKEKRERRRVWRAVLLALLLSFLGTLVLVVALGLWWALRPGDRMVDPVVSAPIPADVESEPAGERPPSPVSGLIEARLERIQKEGPAYYVNRGSFLLAQEKFPAAVKAFRTAQRQPAITPIERFIAELGEAEGLARGDDVPGALAILERPFVELEYIPEPWRALKEQFRDGLLGEPASATARAPLVNAFAVDRAADGVGEATDEGAVGDTGDSSPMRVEIDTTRYLLTVLENNAIRAVYPVGLGAGNFTPEGRYTIVNKIEEPDWYNNGDVVPAGDPDNQLGSRWLGLGDGEGPIPIGIHATDALGSIGGNESRGCIRMRPKDVEALFDLVSVGTAVHIRAL